MTQVAELIVDSLMAAGVRRIYGVVGDSLNGLTEAVRQRKEIEWVGVRHEEVAAFAAGAEAHLSGKLAVCAGSCGPGHLHLINGLYDCHRPPGRSAVRRRRLLDADGGPAHHSLAPPAGEAGRPQ